VAQVHNTSIWNKDTNNFAPRIGFALDTMGNQKLVLRGGFGTFYDRIYNNIFENIRFNPPFFADEVFGFATGTVAGPTFQPGLFTQPFTSNAQFLNPALFGGQLPKPVPRHMDQNLVTPYYMQSSLGIEYQLTKDMAIEANYVSTLGRKLIGIENRNTFDGKNSCPARNPLTQSPYGANDPCTLDGFPFGFSNSIRPNPLFNSDNARGNYYGSNYNAFNITLKKRFSSGLSFNANYTYAKALDELSDAFRAKNAAISATDVQNLRVDYGPADFDLRHRFVASYNYDVQFMKSNRWLGGWALNGIFSWSTGSPVALLDNFSGREDGNKDGTKIDRPAFVGSGSITSSIIGKEVGSTYQYLRASDFARVVTTHDNFRFGDTGYICPATAATLGGLWCNSNTGRGAIPGPHFVNFDFGISKNFKITENTKLRFDANFFDIFNHPNFQNPQGSVTDPAFGQSQLTYGDTGGHRVTQLALRFDF